MEKALTVSPAEGVETFYRILESGLPRVIISTHNLEKMCEYVRQQKNAILLDVPGEDTEPGLLAARPELSMPYAPPTNENERKFTAVWERFFSIRAPGVNDDFFELGGDSLKAMTILTHIHREMDIKIPLAQFFENPTIRGLARCTDKGKKEKFTTIEPVEIKEYYELSSAQKRLYIQQQIEGENTNYNMPQIVLLEGDLEWTKSDVIFAEMMRRHESLRTSFKEISHGEPVQIIREEVPLNIRFLEKREEDIRTYVNEFIKPFDLSKAPLMRVEIIKIGEQRHYLMLDMHHIITDAYSHEIFVDELMALYTGREISEHRISYKDFSRWQNRMFTSGAIKKQEEYWWGVFKDGVPVMNLVTDFPRPALRTQAGDQVEFELDENMTAALNRAATETGTTLFMILMAAYYVLAAKIADQEDIVVGIDISGRTHADLENIIGMFVNILALRNYPEKEKNFRQFTAEVRKNALDAYENQQYPFEELVRNVAKKREPGRNPLFDITFAMLNVDIAGKETSRPNLDNELKVTRCEFEDKKIKYDLGFVCDKLRDKIIVKCYYSTELFNRSTIEKLKLRYSGILTQVIDNLDIKLKNIDISHGFKEAGSGVLHEDTGDFGF
ncbi:MAG: hypothetical protein GY757_56950 [bacterium]|nr:hypothetical protein [bacterium]